MAAALGLDFGTTNSAVALADGRGAPRLARFPSAHGSTDTFRSILYFDPKPVRGAESAFAGPAAVERYRQAPHKGRFLQSLKAYLGDAGFTGTMIGGRQRTLPQLIAMILQRLLHAAAQDLGELPHRAVIGRPVHFTVARSEEHDALALERMREALALAGVTDFEFEYEPVAAAYAYQQRLTEPATVLIGDFGGGTSDFSILALEPATTPGRGVAILGNDGVAVAGDAFDRAIVRHAVAPQLGKGSDYLSPPDKVLPMPEWIYSRLERWHHLSFLKAGETLEMLRRIERTSTAKQAVAALLHLIEEDLGYELHEQVNATKIALSSTVEADLRFDIDGYAVRSHVAREAFEHWLRRDLQLIERSVEQLFARARLSHEAIDTVFLTGGSSFVPAVRAIFTRLFPTATITGGHELTSVATGLALRARTEQ
ncbi:MAG: Hsp70 family protein [Acidobacteria bacterium]|nr:Hsp70 family protein [Acidobacteriota bacterium]